MAKTGIILGTDTGLLLTARSLAAAWAAAAARRRQLRLLVATHVLPPVTFTCVPVGSGSRMAIDRDGDGYADFDELLAGTNPRDPNSHP